MMKKLFCSFLLVSGVFCSAAEPAAVPPELARIRSYLQTKARGQAPWTWIFYGDSITHGAKHTHGWRSFPEIFAERLRYELGIRLNTVINSGISGNTTANLLDGTQYYHRIKKFSPSVVILMIGTNDIVRIKDINVYRKNLETLVEKIRKDKAYPVLMTLPGIWKNTKRRDYIARLKGLDAYNAVIRETAGKYNTVLVDNASRWEKIAPTADKQKKFLGEELHPGPMGHLEIAREIFRVFGIDDPAAVSSNPVGREYMDLDLYHKTQQKKKAAGK